MDKRNAISQLEFQRALLPILRDEGVVYTKFKPVLAKRAQGGETIETSTGDGVETKNQAGPSDYIVKNCTKAKELYIVKDSAFHARYKFNKKAEDGYSQYLPTGKVIAVTLTGEIMGLFGKQDELFFLASWNEAIVAKKGDLLVCPLDFSEIYRIARKEFDETYREII